LLSLLTVGTPTAGTPSFTTKGEIGIEPPLILVMGVIRNRQQFSVQIDRGTQLAQRHCLEDPLRF